MGINVNLAYLFDAAVEDLRSLGLEPTGQTLPGEDASSDLGTSSVMRVGEDLVLVVGDVEHVADPAQLAARLGRRVVAVIMGSTGDTYSFGLADGAAGVGGPVLLRHVVDSQGERYVDAGDPLPEEAGIDRLDEDSTLGLLHAVTGFTPFTDQHLAADFAVLGPSRPRRRRFWPRRR